MKTRPCPHCRQPQKQVPSFLFSDLLNGKQTKTTGLTWIHFGPVEAETCGRIRKEIRGTPCLKDRVNPLLPITSISRKLEYK